MTNRILRPIPFFLSFIFLINLGLFAFVNSRPIHWLQDELPCYRFFWSMDNVNELTLHSGLTSSDFIKPFAGRYTNGAFRPRHISNFFEMFSFKIMQSFEIGYFRDYSLISLHLFNVFLLWILVRLLTNTTQSAWLAAALMLNSGIALATLYFPFRPAKLLAVAFLLINWIILASTKKPFYLATNKKLFSFFAILLLSFFTDESYFLLVPALFIFLIYRDGLNATLKSRLIWPLLTTLASFLFLLYFLYHFSESIEQSQSWYGSYFSNFKNSLFNTHTYQDTLKAFFEYFLRRSLGYWSFSLLGGMAFIAFSTLLVLGLKQNKNINDLGFLICLITLILIKSILLPHMHIHPFIMPPETTFPSMLFFSYYYPYADAMIICLALAFFLKNKTSSQQSFHLCLGLITLINISNAAHIKEGIQDTLQYHGLDNDQRKKAVEDLLLIKQVMNSHPNESIYLSFYTGNSDLLDGRFGFDDSWPVYAGSIMTMYLRKLEDGHLITSLTNIQRKNKLASNDELNISDWFYDVQNRQLLNLSNLKRNERNKSFHPTRLTAQQWMEFKPVALVDSLEKITILVKGYADIQLIIDGQEIEDHQTYGESYQIIQFTVKQLTNSADNKAILRLKPSTEKNSISMIGPYLTGK